MDNLQRLVYVVHDADSGSHPGILTGPLPSYHEQHSQLPRWKSRTGSPAPSQWSGDSNWSIPDQDHDDWRVWRASDRYSRSPSVASTRTVRGPTSGDAAPPITEEMDSEMDDSSVADTESMADTESVSSYVFGYPSSGTSSQSSRASSVVSMRSNTSTRTNSSITSSQCADDRMCRRCRLDLWNRPWPQTESSQGDVLNDAECPSCGNSSRGSTPSASRSVTPTPSHYSQASLSSQTSRYPSSLSSSSSRYPSTAPSTPRGMSVSSPVYASSRGGTPQSDRSLTPRPQTPPPREVPNSPVSPRRSTRTRKLSAKGQMVQAELARLASLKRRKSSTFNP
jgi:hypothetical protein